MSAVLTPGHHALLETELQLARQRVQVALQAQLGGQDRVAHAVELLGDDPRDLREHEVDRELDQTRTDQLQAELAEIDDALQRLNTPGYGHCIDCDVVIPFDRLKTRPQALRCVGCQTAAEAAH